MDYALQVSGTYDHVLDAARFAIDRGLVALALPDHYLMAVTEEAAKEAPAPDAFIQLGGLARETDGIELVVLVQGANRGNMEPVIPRPRKREKGREP